MSHAFFRYSFSLHTKRHKSNLNDFILKLNKKHVFEFFVYIHSSCEHWRNVSFIITFVIYIYIHKYFIFKDLKAAFVAFSKSKNSSNLSPIVGIIYSIIISPETAVGIYFLQFYRKEFKITLDLLQRWRHCQTPSPFQVSTSTLRDKSHEHRSVCSIRSSRTLS